MHPVFEKIRQEQETQAMIAARQALPRAQTAAQQNQSGPNSPRLRRGNLNNNNNNNNNNNQQSNVLQHQNQNQDVVSSSPVASSRSASSDPASSSSASTNRFYASSTAPPTPLNQSTNEEESNNVVVASINPADGFESFDVGDVGSSGGGLRQEDLDLLNLVAGGGSTRNSTRNQNQNNNNVSNSLDRSGAPGANSSTFALSRASTQPPQSGTLNLDSSSSTRRRQSLEWEVELQQQFLLQQLNNKS